MVYDPVGSKHWSNCLVVTLHKWKKGVTKPGDLEPVCTLMKHEIVGEVHDYIDLKFAKDKDNVKMPADFKKGDYDLLDYHLAVRPVRFPPLPLWDCRTEWLPSS
jgi:hypothetical protein